MNPVSYIRKALVYSILMLCPFFLFAQDGNMEGVKKKANEFFIAKDYQKAKELYSQLVSLYPRDENYNYRFGACMLYVDSDKNYPLKFLEYAVSKPSVHPEAFYYLGKGYHYNYQFDKAILYFEKYLQKAASQDGDKLPAETEIRHCKNGKKLLNNIKNPRVLNVAKVSKADFFAAIKVRETGAKLLYAPAEFHSSVDKKKGYTPVMYSNKQLNVVFFSSYGKSTKNGLDLYIVRINNGEFSEPMKLSSIVNTSYDDAFAYLSNDGRTFFFASKGHNSMGGFDLFTCYFDSANNTFTQPVNLDYVINTPDDDFMYAEIPEQEIAYFASNRNSDKGKAYVYKVALNAKPFQFAVIDGTFTAKTTKSVKITIEDLTTKTELGTFSSSKKDGKFVLRLESGGKYNFLVEPYGSNIAYQGRVDVPKGTSRKVLRQEIEIVSAEGQEDRLVIRNLFEEGPGENDAAILAQVYASNAQLKETPKPTITASNEEIVAELSQKRDEIGQNLNELKQESIISLNLANSFKEEAQELIEKAEALAPSVSLNDVTTEGVQKQQELNDLVAKAKDNGLQAKAAIELYENYQKSIALKETELAQQETILNNAQEALNDGNRALLEGLMESQNQNEADGNDSMVNQLIQTQNNLVLKGKKVLMKAKVANEQQVEIEEEIVVLKAQQKATKKKKEKDAIQLRINALQEEIPEIKKSQESYLAQAAEISTQQAAVKQKLMVISMITEGKSEATPVAVSTQVETAALSASIAETIKEIYLVEEQVSTDAKIIVKNDNVADSTLVLNNESDSSNQMFSLQNDTISNNRADEVVSSDTPLTNEPAGHVNNLTPNTVGAGGTVALENSGADSSVYFNYSEEYEELGDNNLELDGEIIPLSITSNTGKKPYSKEELADVDVVLGDAAYHQEFMRQQDVLTQEDNGLEKAKKTQQLQYNWVVSMEKERAAILYAASETENKNYSAQLTNKANEMEGEIGNKRNFLALNARIIEQLERNANEPTPVLVNEAFSDSTIINEDTNNLLSSEINTNVNSSNQSEGISHSDSLNVVNNVGAENELNAVNNEEVKNVSASAKESNMTVSLEKGDGDENQDSNSKVEGSQFQNNSTIVPSNEAFVPVVIMSVSVVDDVTEQASLESEQATKRANLETQKLAVLETELEETRKKKDKKALAEQIKKQKQQSGLAIEKEKLMQERIVAIEETKAVVIENPLAELPSKKYKSESISLNNTYAEIETEIADLELELAATKKKKKKKLLLAEIETKELQKDSVNALAQIATTTLLAIEQTEVHTLKTATPYGTGVMINLPVDSAFIDEKEAETLKLNPAYVSYIGQKTEAEKQLRDAEVLTAAANEKMEEARLLNLSLEELELLLQITSGDEKQAIQDEINLVVSEQKKLIKGANVFYTQAKAKENEAYYLLNEANKELLAIPVSDERNQIIALVNNNVTMSSDLASANNEVIEPITDENVNVIPPVLNQPIFKQNDTVYYSSANPIPVDVTLPSGVVLKVQIGAFRNQISQNAFAGFAPIVGERTASGLTRYTAGLFTKFEEADLAKNAIRSKGYSDAFIVAYLNGKRISITRARQILNGETPITSVDVTAQNTTQNNNQIATSNVMQESVTPVQSGDQIKVSDVAKTGELFFTVQIGVYNSRVNPNSVFSITPLNTDVMSNGLIRYSAGKYASLEAASKARTVVRASGILDAFVTAYFNGERITIARAKELLASQKNITSSSGTVPNRKDGKTVFYLQVGPYSGQIPVDQAMTLLEMNRYGIKIERNSEGTFYKIGNLNTQNEAQVLKQKLVSRNILNPKIVESGNN